MQSERKYLIGDSKIPKELECPICLDPLEQPVEHIACHNMFCYKCLNGIEQCPLCCKQIYENELQKITVNYINNILNEITVKCLQCEKIIKRIDFLQHIEENCAKLCHIGCNKMIIPIELANHIEICPFRKIDCSEKEYGCLWNGEYYLFHEHKESCEYIKAKPVISKYLETKLYDFSKYKDIGPFPENNNDHHRFHIYTKDLLETVAEIYKSLEPGEKFIYRIFYYTPMDSRQPWYPAERGKCITISNYGTVIQTRLHEDYRSFDPNQYSCTSQYQIMMVKKKLPTSFFEGLLATNQIMYSSGPDDFNYLRFDHMNQIVEIIKKM